jgi:hypothetical protein
VIIATFAEDGPAMCSGLPVKRYSADDFKAVMGAGFNVVETRSEQHVTPSGGTQSFQWTLAQRV